MDLKADIKVLYRPLMRQSQANAFENVQRQCCDSKGGMTPFRAHQCQSHSGCFVGITDVSVCACVFAYIRLCMCASIAIGAPVCMVHVCVFSRQAVLPVLCVFAFTCVGGGPASAHALV